MNQCNSTDRPEQQGITSYRNACHLVLSDSSVATVIQLGATVTIDACKKKNYRQIHLLIK